MVGKLLHQYQQHQLHHGHVYLRCRFMVYFFSGAAFKSCCGDLDEGPEIEITYESALQSAYSKKASSNRKLAGTPTYRLPHHPRYRDMFGDNAAYKPLWFKAFGRDRYTQLVRVLVCKCCSYHTVGATGLPLLLTATSTCFLRYLALVGVSRSPVSLCWSMMRQRSTSCWRD